MSPETTFLDAYQERRAQQARDRVIAADEAEWGERVIVTSHVYPPIPIREFDWCAFYEGEEEAGNYGYGPTEAEAIRDFIENCAEDHDERLVRLK